VSRRVGGIYRSAKRVRIDGAAGSFNETRRLFPRLPPRYSIDNKFNRSRRHQRHSFVGCRECPEEAREGLLAGFRVSSFLSSPFLLLISTDEFGARFEFKIETSAARPSLSFLQAVPRKLTLPAYILRYILPNRDHCRAARSLVAIIRK